jgi:predicted ATPase
LAHHYTEAGLNEQAIRYWHKAGQRSVERSANVEAIAHLTKGLELLKTLPDTSERALQELTLQRHLGVALIVTKGFAAPEVEHAYARARELCQHVGDTQQVFPVLFGLWGYYHTAMDLPTARGLAEQLLILAQRQHDSALILQGNRALGDTLHRLGEFVAARTYLEQGIELYDRQQHHSHALRYGQDPGMGCLGFAAIVLWMLGYPEQALQRSHQALTVAQDVSHPFSLTFALSLAGRLHTLRREWRVAQEQAETMIALSTEQGNAFHLAAGTTMRACALIMQHPTEEEIAQIRQSFAARRTTGMRTVLPWLALLAEAYGKVGQAEEGLTVLFEAQTYIDHTGDRFCESELSRLTGELLLKHAIPDPGQAATCFQRALDIARHQEAKSLELRAAMSLSRLWQRQGKQKQAYELLAEVYGWFTEGFDTADLQEAQSLLEALSS